MQFLFKSTNNSWRNERNCEWVFFSEHSVQATSIYMYSVSQKNHPLRPAVFWHFFHKLLRILNQFLYTYYTLLSTLDYKFLFSYLKF